MIDQAALHRGARNCRRCALAFMCGGSIFLARPRAAISTPNTVTSILLWNSTGVHPPSVRRLFRAKGRVGGSARPEGRFGGAKRSAQSVSQGEYRRLVGAGL